MRKKKAMVLVIGLTVVIYVVYAFLGAFELLLIFGMFKPVLTSDRSGWSFLVLTIAIAVVDVVIYQRFIAVRFHPVDLARRLLNWTD